MTTTTTATALRTFQIDKTHSEVGFQVRHLLTKVRGGFSDFSGTVEFDEAQPERSSVNITIQTASIDTRQPDRDAHLRNADFFDADRFPTLTFVSTKLAKRDGQDFDVTGDLTIRDVTKTVTLPVTHLGMAKDPWGNQRLGFETEFTINRSDFGLTWNAVLETGGFLVGEEIRISLSVQAIGK